MKLAYEVIRRVGLPIYWECVQVGEWSQSVKLMPWLNRFESKAKY